MDPPRAPRPRRAAGSRRRWFEAFSCPCRTVQRCGDRNTRARVPAPMVQGSRSGQSTVPPRKSLRRNKALHATHRHRVTALRQDLRHGRRQEDAVMPLHPRNSETAWPRFTWWQVPATCRAAPATVGSMWATTHRTSPGQGRLIARVGAAGARGSARPSQCLRRDRPGFPRRCVAAGAPTFPGTGDRSSWTGMDSGRNGTACRAQHRRRRAIARRNRKRPA